MSGVLRAPWLVFSFVVDRLRRLPGARFVAPLVPWLARLMIAAAVVLLVLWGFEASPQRLTLAELAAGKLGTYQTWIIISGDLAEERGSTQSSPTYRLTDLAAPNAYLVVRSQTQQALGPTTLSGHIEGGRDGVPAGYEWSARLTADPQLAAELPPPMAALVLIAAGVLMLLARRTRYPLFVPEPPGDARPASNGLRATVRADTNLSDGPFGNRAHAANLKFDRSGRSTAELRLPDRPPLAVQLHSAFTSIDVGRLRSLSASEPALRVRAADDDLILGFESARDRDVAFATLGAEAARLRPAG